jgi:hypothetical protein
MLYGLKTVTECTPLSMCSRTVIIPLYHKMCNLIHLNLVYKISL